MDRNRQNRVLIAGGGVAALEAALALRNLAEDRVRVELLAPEPHFWYRPLAVAAPFRLGKVLQLGLDAIAREIGAGLTPGGLVGIDAWRHVAHTSKNMQLEYDMLLIACGAVPMPAIPGARSFRGPADIEVVEELLHDLSNGSASSVAFVVPWGAVYSLPAYELALLTASHVERHGVAGIEISVVTPEAEPLQVFGPPASDAIRRLLSDRGVALWTGAYCDQVVDDMLRLIPDGALAVDRCVALPRLMGPPIDGIPQTVHGFVPVDAHCRVHGIDDVYAAGDITSFTVKQGGIATQQADAAAEAIAAAVGVDIEPARFRPVLRGALLTGAQPRYLRRELAFEPENEPVASLDALWWPPAKIVGRFLSPFLATLVDAELPSDELPDDVGAVRVEQTFEPDIAAQLDTGRPLPGPDTDDARVADVMAGEALVMAPEDTLGETAERMLRAEARAVAVAEYGQLIGILTTSDLLRAAAARAHPEEARVRQWMTAEPITVSGEMQVGDARVLMDQYGIDVLPVVHGRAVTGLVDRTQLDAALVPNVGLGF
jgi:sulfide:quinone oxidoreductase